MGVQASHSAEHLLRSVTNPRGQPCPRWVCATGTGSGAWPSRGPSPSAPRPWAAGAPRPRQPGAQQPGARQPGAQQPGARQPGAGRRPGQPGTGGAPQAAQLPQRTGLLGHRGQRLRYTCTALCGHGPARECTAQGGLPHAVPQGPAAALAYAAPAQLPDEPAPGAGPRGGPLRARGAPQDNCQPAAGALLRGLGRGQRFPQGLQAGHVEGPRVLRDLPQRQLLGAPAQRATAPASPLTPPPAPATAPATRAVPPAARAPPACSQGLFLLGDTSGASWRLLKSSPQAPAHPSPRPCPCLWGSQGRGP